MQMFKIFKNQLFIKRIHYNKHFTQVKVIVIKKYKINTNYNHKQIGYHQIKIKQL
jgi:hypothetical protein